LGSVFCHKQSKSCPEGPLAKFTDPNMAAVVRKILKKGRDVQLRMCGGQRAASFRYSPFAGHAYGTSRETFSGILSVRKRYHSSCVTLCRRRLDKTIGTTTRIGFIYRGQHHAPWTHFLPGFIAFLSDRRRVDLRIISFQEPSHVVRPKRGCCHLEAPSVFHAACRNLSRAQY
jgi:hypothetical protein